MSTSKILFWCSFVLCIVAPLVIAAAPFFLFGSMMGFISVPLGYITYLVLLAPKLQAKPTLLQHQKLCFLSTLSVRTLGSQVLAFALIAVVIPQYYSVSKPSLEIVFYGSCVCVLASVMDFMINKWTKRFPEDPTTNR